MNLPHVTQYNFRYPSTGAACENRWKDYTSHHPNCHYHCYSQVSTTTHTVTVHVTARWVVPPTLSLSMLQLGEFYHPHCHCPCYSSRWVLPPKLSLSLLQLGVYYHQHSHCPCYSQVSSTAHTVTVYVTAGWVVPPTVLLSMLQLGEFHHTYCHCHCYS